MTYYIIRFDDINPKMDWNRFNKFKSTINKYKIKSILGVIPKCEDREISQFPEYKEYYSHLKKMKSEGDFIAQHGYRHLNDSRNEGLYGYTKRSEFAGLDYEAQYEKINKGKEILTKHQIWQPIFMAPFHTFDNTTLKVLKKLDFKLVSDGCSRYPYDLNGIKLIPQLTSMPLPTFLPLVSQLCIHINSLSDDKLQYLTSFIEKNNQLFISPLDALKYENNSILNRLENKIITFLLRIFRSIKKFI